MKLKECYVKEFGGIKDLRISFSDGLCAFIGKNGAGKTTLAVFIKAMLYGIGDTKKASLEENDRRHYLPRSEGYCGGTLTFYFDGKEYRIERSFGKRATDDRCTVYDVKSGKVTDRFQKGIGESLFGIDAEGFERTLYLSERNLSASSDPDSISSRLSSLVSTDMDIDALDRARKVLDEQRKFYTKKGSGGEIASTRAEISKINEKIEALDGAEKRIDLYAERLSQVDDAERELKERGDRLAERKAALMDNGIKDALSTRLDRLNGELLELTEKKNGLLDFFDGEVPSYSEIERHRGLKNEAQILLGGGIDSREKAEYEGLSAFFADRCNLADIEKACDNASVLEKSSEKIEKIKTDNGDLFSTRIPKVCEINDAIERYESKKAGKGLFGKIATVLGFLLSAIFAICGYLYDTRAYYFSAVGILLLCIGVIVLVVRKARIKTANGLLCGFIASVANPSYVRDKDAKLLIHEMLSVRRKLEDIEFDKVRAEENLSTFLAKFFTRYCTDAVKATYEIAEKYRRYLSLKSTISYVRERGNAARERGELLLDTVASFLARYKVGTERPFEELTDICREYERITERIISVREEIEGLSSVQLYSVVSKSEDDSEDRIARDKAKLEDDMRRLTRERTLIEGEYRRDEAALSQLEELRDKRAKLATRVEKYEKIARTIALTAAHLGYAAENMTERYLGKSRESLSKYASLLSSRNERKVNIDTCLEISVTEQGTTYPAISFSRGERELYGLCVRLGLIDALFEGEEPFVVLDDPFISFDDDSIRAAKALLEKLGKHKQILYFTCSESRSFTGAVRL